MRLTSDASIENHTLDKTTLACLDMLLLVHSSNDASWVIAVACFHVDLECQVTCTTDCCKNLEAICTVV